MSAEQFCRLCEGGLDLLADFTVLPRVTSDARPWPAGGELAVCRDCGLVQHPDTLSWRAEAAAIYAEYGFYLQADGAEQAVFVSGQPRRRSEQVLDSALAVLALPEQGRAVDIGCGNGGMLTALSSRLPGWRLTGYDQDNRSAKLVEAIPGVEVLHVGPLGSLAGLFDFATLAHSLEHFQHPAKTLAAIRRQLTPDGALLVEVPDHRANPFDLVLADHACHFSPATLDATLRAGGFDPLTVTCAWVPKELSAVARPGPPQAPGPAECGARKGAEAGVAWLSALAAQARAAASTSKGVAVFGSSIGASWMVGLLGEAVTLLVDEDTTRLGHFHLGRPIVLPAQVPDGTTVLVPLAPAVGAAVVARLGQGPGEWLAPPRLTS
ncbi:MAG: class I SAM-dependent methyltransferase [Alphaproteobacteria bacterium]|nr:class I SAM-dependent methyltransferase [Alphaproteobacteria bacterium]